MFVKEEYDLDEEEKKWMTRYVHWIFNDRNYFTSRLTMKNNIAISDEASVTPDEYYGKMLEEQIERSLIEKDMKRSEWMESQFKTIAWDYFDGGEHDRDFLNTLDSLAYYLIKNGYQDIHEVRVYEEDGDLLGAYVLEHKVHRMF